MTVNVISKRGLGQQAKALKVDESAAAELNIWYRVARQAAWTNLAAVRTDFPSADQVGHVLVFNIRHNRYRLIVRSSFPIQKLYVKALMTHKEYEREEWKKWA